LTTAVHRTSNSAGVAFSSTAVARFWIATLMVDLICCFDFADLCMCLNNSGSAIDFTPVLAFEFLLVSAGRAEIRM
jgi:hypothetical protein